LKGRDKEAALIRDTNVACAVGRLLLGDTISWNDFLEPDTVDYSKLPRKQLKSGKHDIQGNLQRRIDSFCKNNFPNMTKHKLVALYEILKSHQTFEMPYVEFCNKFSSINNFHESGYPVHSTVYISLWGLQYRFPEKDFANDLVIALELFVETSKDLSEFRKLDHAKIKPDKKFISKLVRKNESSKRQVMQSSFSLLECYLNGISWAYCQSENDIDLSKTKISTLKDTNNVTLRDKIKKYPKIIFNKDINEMTYEFTLNEAKHYRDSLMHPSPFSAPEKFGGYDKLEKLYNLNEEIIFKTIHGVINIIEEIENMKGKNSPTLIWIPEVKSQLTIALTQTNYSVV